MRTKILIIGLSILLVGCSSKSLSENLKPSNHIVYKNMELGYLIELPSLFSQSGSSMNSLTNEVVPFFGSAVDKSVNPPFGKREANLTFHSRPSKKCSPLVTGVLSPTIFMSSSTKMIWGRVDVWDGMGNEGWEPPFEESDETVCSYKVIPEPGSNIYAMCSQQGDKTIIACLNLTKNDNPTFAKEIFESFRWTE